MEKVTRLFKKLGVGFYFTIVVAIVSIVGASMYASTVLGNDTVIGYSMDYYKSAILFLPLLGGIFAIILLVVAVVLELLLQDGNRNKKLIVNILAKLAPWVLLGLNLIVFMILVPNVIDIVMFLAQGDSSIAQSVEDSRILTPAILLAAAMFMSIAAVFIPMFFKGPAENLSGEAKFGDGGKSMAEAIRTETADSASV